MEQTNKERFLELLRKVNREGMDKLIAWLESSTFFVDPASAKYHGDYDKEIFYKYKHTLETTVKQALLEFKRLDLSLRLPSEQSSSQFTYKDKNLVCMQSTKYSKLMNASLEYEKAQEMEKVLKVIFEKNVDILTLNSWFSKGIGDLKTYNYDLEDKDKLTQEEFDTLKRYSKK